MRLKAGKQVNFCGMSKLEDVLAGKRYQEAAENRAAHRITEAQFQALKA